MIVTLPWPHKNLTPNAKRRLSHWVYGPIAANAKQEGWALTCEQMQPEARAAVVAGPERIAMTIKFYPPDKRHRDDDGMIGSFKHHRDGVALALGCDDRRFRPHYFFEEPCKPGRIEVEFSPIIDVFPHQNSAVHGGAVLGESGPTKRTNASSALTNNAKEIANGS